MTDDLPAVRLFGGDSSLNELPQISEKHFNRLKHIHRSKVEMSEFLDSYKKNFELFAGLNSDFPAMQMKKVVDLTSLDRRTANLGMFAAALDKKKKTLEYIETAPRILMSIEKIRAVYGLNVEEIREIQYFVLYNNSRLAELQGMKK